MKKNTETQKSKSLKNKTGVKAGTSVQGPYRLSYTSVQGPFKTR